MNLFEIDSFNKNRLIICCMYFLFFCAVTFQFVRLKVIDEKILITEQKICNH